MNTAAATERPSIPRFSANPEQQLAADSSSGDTSSAGHDWYESAAILVCPLH